MSASVYAILRSTYDYTCSAFISFHFIKDRYIPYTYARGKFISPMSLENTHEIVCFVNGKPVHQGIIDRLERTRVDGNWIYTFESRGYTLLLGQNEPVPKMNYDVNLTSLAQINTNIPRVTFQSGTDNVNYIYVKEKSTIWDAICAYAAKAYGTIPYIYTANQVRVTPLCEKTHNYSKNLVTRSGNIADNRYMISHVNMAGTSGEYEYIDINKTAVSKNIIREKFYPLDKQWLYSPEKCLTNKLAFSNRRYNQKFFTYIGFNYEELFDKVYPSTQQYALGSCTIHRIEIEARDMEIFTTIFTFEDEN